MSVRPRLGQPSQALHGDVFDVPRGPVTGRSRQQLHPVLRRRQRCIFGVQRRRTSTRVGPTAGSQRNQKQACRHRIVDLDRLIV
jgi:hypothetical protein